VNVEGQNGAALNFSSPDAYEVCSYLGPKPPPGTGYHRYIFLIYQQHQKIDTKSIHVIAQEKMEERKNFYPDPWLQKTFSGTDSVKLIAGNFFLAGTADESLANKTEQQMKDEAKQKATDTKDKATGHDDKNKK